MKIQVPVSEEWTVGEWKNGGVHIEHPHEGGYSTGHERNIPTTWPEPVRKAASEIIRANRPTEENETRHSRGGVALQTDRPERLAFLDKHAPELAENEVLASDGNRFRLRWLLGRREYTAAANEDPYGYVCYDTSNGAIKGNTRAEAWFAANRPLEPNEHRNKSGEVFKFRELNGVISIMREFPSVTLWYPLNSWSDETRAAAESWSNKNRPLALNETISTSGKRGTMSIENAPYRFNQPRLCVFWEDESMSFYARSVLSSQGGDWARRLAFFEANLPNERVVDGYKLRRISDSEVKILTPFTYEATFRREWSGLSGGAIFRLVNLDTLSESVIRACCDLLNVKRELPLADHVLPANQYRLPNGEVLTFRMRDDGHAEAVDKRGHAYAFCTKEECESTDSLWFRALHAWRDAEVKRWEFEWRETYVSVAFDGKHNRGTWNERGACFGLEDEPPWVRARAEALWNERVKKVEPVVFEAKWEGTTDQNVITFWESAPRWSGECQRVSGLPRGTVRVTIEAVEG